MMRPLIALFSLVISVPLFASNPITNYKSGISIGFAGEDEKAYAFERWYHDPLTDDHGVVYIKDSIKISLAHNERNTAYIKGPGVVAPEVVDPSKGVIRYRVDRDLNYKYSWVGGTFPDCSNGRPGPSPAGSVFPKFEAPFSFSELTFGPDDPSVKVVGATGPKPGVEISNRAEYYHRGMVDAAGDEWHIITVGDDDTGVDSFKEQARQLASDGKIHYFIVNPKTPAIYFTTASDKAQFYTTPIKHYFIPVLHEQTSYVTGGVKINLVNIMSNAPVYYRWDGQGEFLKYTAPISVDALKDGEHALEYYYQTSHHRTRKIVKNPGYPSDKDVFADGSKHGYLLWKNDAEFQRVKERLTGASDSPDVAIQQKVYQNYVKNRGGNGNMQQPFDAVKRKGLKVDLREMNKEAPLINALVAQVEGLDKAASYASYSKQMMLENQYLVDWVGYELDQNFGAQPGYNFSCGYYQSRPLIAIAFAYDLLITKFRPPTYADGFTPIEDLKIRDMMAQFTVTALMWRGGYVYGCPYLGMWGTARNIGGLVAALAMPSYNTPYLGTSGFDGATTNNKWLPFPDQAATWKQTEFLGNVPSMPYPNQTSGYMMDGTKGQAEATFDGATGKGKLSNLEDCYIMPDGTGHIGTGMYRVYNLMGIITGIYSNVLRIKLDQYDDCFDKYFEKCNNGTQPPDVRHNSTVTYFPNLLAINEYHSDKTAQVSLDATKASKDYERAMDVYGLLWVHPDWKTLPRPAPAEPSPSR
jgi:hypothetical protein